MALIQSITDKTATSLGLLHTVATKQLAFLVDAVRQKAASNKVHAKKRIGIESYFLTVTGVADKLCSILLFVPVCKLYYDV